MCEPTSARKAIAPARIITRTDGLTSTWLALHSVKLHIIGWRVIWKAPLGRCPASSLAPGCGKAGLPMNDPTSSTEAASISMEASAHGASPAPFHGKLACGGMARKARTIQTKLASATSE